MNLKRILVAGSLAMMCMTATMAQKKMGVEKIDLTEIGVDSAMQSRMSDSTVVALAKLSIEHKEKMAKEELRHDEQIQMMRHQRKANPFENTEGVLFIVGIFSTIPIICLLIYKIILNRSRRRREEANNAMLLNLVSNGQALTPELVESITHDKEQEKKTGELTMYTSLRKLFLGCGLIVFAIVFAWRVSGIEPVSSIFALIGIFYAAQGQAGYITLKQEKQSENE